MKGKKPAARLALILSLLVFCKGCKTSSISEDIGVNDLQALKARLVILTENDPITGGQISSGIFKVFENREKNAGRMLELDIIILHALDPEPKPDPVFVLSGGPGQSSADLEYGYVGHWLRSERDIVLISQRGTEKSNRLACDLNGIDDNLQADLDTAFAPEYYQSCLEELSKRADLTMYSTYAAMDDLNEARLALGYEKINLIGTSYGTRSALVYMRRYPQSVRCAILNGVAPLAFINPLFHAQGAQKALDLLMAECASDPDCNSAFPNLKEELKIILKRLKNAPAVVAVHHPDTGERISLKLSRDTFAEALRLMMYSLGGNRMVPFLIHQVYTGNYEPFVRMGLQRNRDLRQSLSFGTLLCVTCAEDVARIDPEDIPRMTEGTFHGDFRVRQQTSICSFWPKSKLPADYDKPMKVNVPVLLLSGTQDPVTPPRWGEEAARHLPNSIHVVAPGAHAVGGPCIRHIQEQFLNTGSVAGLDTSCVKSMKLPSFRLRGDLR